jgi:hypothetical protein
VAFVYSHFYRRQPPLIPPLSGGKLVPETFQAEISLIFKTASQEKERGGTAFSAPLSGSKYVSAGKEKLLITNYVPGKFVPDYTYKSGTGYQTIARAVRMDTG